MVNALSLATCLSSDGYPPWKAKRWEATTGAIKEFYYLNTMIGSVDKVEMHYIVRDFERQWFEARKQLMITSGAPLGKGLLHSDCYIEIELS